MKRILTTLLAAFSFIVCFGQAKPKPAFNQPSKAKLFEAAQSLKRQSLVSQHIIANAGGTSMDEEDAKRFVRNYQNAKLATTVEAIHFDKMTIESFSDLFKQQKIDGIRAYLARYDNGNFTIILVGTKTVGTRHVDQVIRLGGATVVASIQNFGDPCPPPGCDGNTIGGGN